MPARTLRLAVKTLHPAVLMLLCVLLYAGSAFIKIERYDNFTALVGFGCLTHDICYARNNEHMLPPNALVYLSGGYDGQFFYYLAAEIQGRGPAVLDSDAFRRSRIGYALLIAPAFLMGNTIAVVWQSVLLLAMHLLTIGVLYAYTYRMHAQDDFLLRTSGSGGGDMAGRVSQWLPVLYAFNPFSLQCFLLNVADGLALALALLALAFILPDLTMRSTETAIASENQKSGGLSLYARLNRLGLPGKTLVALLLIVLAVLTKESMLALIPIILLPALANILRRMFQAGKTRLADSFVPWSAIMVAISVLTVVIISAWWRHVDFSPTLAAERSGRPFEGMLVFLHHPDALISGRMLLIPLLVISLVLVIAECVVLIRRQYKSYEIRSAWIALFDTDMALRFGNVLAAVGIITVISMATADEYWANYANIMRLFTPLVLCLSIVPFAFYNTPAKRTGNWLMLGLLVYFLMFDAAIIRQEWTGRRLPAVSYELMR